MPGYQKQVNFGEDVKEAPRAFWSWTRLWLLLLSLLVLLTLGLVIGLYFYRMQDQSAATTTTPLPTTTFDANAVVMKSFFEPGAMLACTAPADLAPMPNEPLRYQFNQTVLGVGGGMCSYQFDVTYKEGIVNTASLPSFECFTPTLSIATTNTAEEATALASTAKFLTGVGSCFQNNKTLSYHFFVLNATAVESTVVFETKQATFYDQFASDDIRLEYHPSVFDNSVSRRGFSTFNLWTSKNGTAKVDCVDCGVTMPVSLTFTHSTFYLEASLVMSVPITASLNLELVADKAYAYTGSKTLFSTQASNDAAAAAMAIVDPSSILASPFFTLFGGIDVKASGELDAMMGMTFTAAFEATATASLDAGLTTSFAMTQPIQWTRTGPSISAAADLDVKLSLVPTVGCQILEIFDITLFAQPYVEPVFNATGEVSYANGTFEGMGEFCYAVHTGVDFGIEVKGSYHGYSKDFKREFNPNIPDLKDTVRWQDCFRAGGNITLFGGNSGTTLPLLAETTGVPLPAGESPTTLPFIPSTQAGVATTTEDFSTGVFVTTTSSAAQDSTTAVVTTAGSTPSPLTT